MYLGKHLGRASRCFPQVCDALQSYRVPLNFKNTGKPVAHTGHFRECCRKGERRTWPLSCIQLRSHKVAITTEAPLRKANKSLGPNRTFQSMQAGERTNPDGRPVANTILLSIPDQEFSGIRPHLEFV